MKPRPHPNPAPDPDRLYSIEETAEWLGISERTLRAKVKAGQVPCVRIGSRVWRFHRPSVLAKLNK